MFFVMKYHVEKYNLVFVYNKQYDTKGILWKPTLRLMMIVLYIFQFMQIGYFSLKDRRFSLGGLIYILVQTILLIMLSFYRMGKFR
jgi:Calcium-dependent channel, 7TM region, putative phosphate